MRLGRLILCCILLLTGYSILAAPQYAYRVSFANKGGTVLNLSNPLSFLSQRAVDRRNRLGISIDSSDLPVSPVHLQNVLTLTSGILHVTSRWLNDCVVLLSDSTQIHQLDNKPYVIATKFVGYYSAQLHSKHSDDTAEVINSSAAQRTTGTAAYYGSGPWAQTSMVHGDFLHDMGYKGEGMMIAVLDDGFAGINTDPYYATLISSGRLVDQYNFVLKSATANMVENHGVQCLSTMAANIAGQYVGSAPNAKYVIYSTEQQFSERPIELDNFVAGLERADSVGVDVVSSSLGYNTFDDPSLNLTFSELDGATTIAARDVNWATSKGMLIIMSAGNEGGDTWNNILTPGDADSALTIGNVDANGVIAGNSGFGPNAAGVQKPDVCTLGFPASIVLNGAVTGGTGTSFSTPQIAGWAACLWQSYPTAKPYDIRYAINKCADHYTTPDNHRGYGIPNFQCAYATLSVGTLDTTHAAWLVLMNGNPFTDNITLQINSSKQEGVHFSLTDMSGKVLWITEQQVTPKQELTLSFPDTLPTGMYVLKATSDSHTQSLRLVKQ